MVQLLLAQVQPPRYTSPCTHSCDELKTAAFCPPSLVHSRADFTGCRHQRCRRVRPPFPPPQTSPSYSSSHLHPPILELATGWAAPLSGTLLTADEQTWSSCCCSEAVTSAPRPTCACRVILQSLGVCACGVDVTRCVCRGETALDAALAKNRRFRASIAHNLTEALKP
jgi:hypothetical protein